jgi:sulfide:quinone oxidoreductase
MAKRKTGARIVILGAGLGGVIAAYEIRKAVRRKDHVVIINEASHYQFVPSNPWVLVGWREPEDITVDLVKPMKKRRVEFIVGKAEKVVPEEKHVRMGDGSRVEYDYLVIATGPDLAFDRVPGLGPEHHTESVCSVDHARLANERFEAFCKNPGPLIAWRAGDLAGRHAGALSAPQLLQWIETTFELPPAHQQKRNAS